MNDRDKIMTNKMQDIQENGQYDTDGAFTESEFESLQQCPLVTINESQPLLALPGYDYYVSFTVHCGTFGGNND